jgi:peptide/nickel transport system permease protein
VALAASTIAALIGTTLGLLGGYFRGLVELLTVRASEVVLCLPPLLLALLVVTLLGPGATTLTLALSILFAPAFARLAYGETLSARELDYVAAQHALGAGSPRILILTVLPNIASPLIVQFSLTVASAMVLESGLSFLGLGVVPPSPSWGLMIRGARASMEMAPLQLVWPCLALTGTVVLLNQLCDRLRDVLDPRGQYGAISGRSRRPVAPSNPPRSTDSPQEPDGHKPLLLVRGLTLRAGGRAPDGLELVREVSFEVQTGETLAVVGESGSGKTLTVLSVMGLLPDAVTPVEGSILLRDRDGATHDLLSCPEASIRSLRGREIAMIFQDPASSLNPLLRIGEQVAESLTAHGLREGVRPRVLSLLKAVGLPDPEQQIDAFPHQLSGGQRQRVMIAAAIANDPSLLLADEPTTALDVTVQAQILELLNSLRASHRGMSMIFVTHNLAVVNEIADRVCVMYAGEVVEVGPVSAVFSDPRHPYTAALIRSTPEGEMERLNTISGTVPQPDAMPSGCRFAARCDRAKPSCASGGSPELLEVRPGRLSRCPVMNQEYA